MSGELQLDDMKPAITSLEQMSDIASRQVDIAKEKLDELSLTRTELEGQLQLEKQAFDEKFKQETSLLNAFKLRLLAGEQLSSSEQSYMIIAERNMRIAQKVVDAKQEELNILNDTIAPYLLNLIKVINI